MPTIRLDSVVVGDVLEEGVAIKGIPLFDAGVVLNHQRLEVLTALGVETVAIESRTDEKNMTVDEAIARIDERFSYVGGIPLMMTFRSWIQDILRRQGERRD